MQLHNNCSDLGANAGVLPSCKATAWLAARSAAAHARRLAASMRCYALRVDPRTHVARHHRTGMMYSIGRAARPGLMAAFKATGDGLLARRAPAPGLWWCGETQPIAGVLTDATHSQRFGAAHRGPRQRLHHTEVGCAMRLAMARASATRRPARACPRMHCLAPRP